ncbi:MAG: PEGA domain-containing protein [candidate division Zixibacteria bacterium]|nr:PEGA domain-containing protein [candidate division Zixibacteria bacterium]NIR63707.1 PEGA domain-containing protein [candidate division Zixibacteria bacterium]NIS14664.1 PEGA domain-containing protein [candidate division Zixibacteria bacterium]NIS45663.1 PEGA domain-containing protein [candidate division Zixibacteria bacterium]NIT51192.1 PEGA domain-containing protein [candidate division Zixibacteria bacterium]
MRIRTCVLLVLLWVAPLLAQTDGNLEVTSDPPGTTITLNGEFRLAGVTPTVFTQPLSGRYTLKASREGYESYETELHLTGGTPLSVNITLAPKTRFKAFIRSMVIPGWGQFYASEKGRGIFFGLAALGSGIVTLIAEEDFNDKKDTYEELLNEFNEERSIEVRKQMEPIINAAREDAYDAETFRNISFGILAGVWTYNIIDALIFFPDKKYESYAPRVSLNTGEDLSSVGLNLSFKF